MYSGYYGSALITQLFIIPLFTIQEWTSFTPGRVILCIVGIMAVFQLFSNLLYSYLLYRNGLYINPLLIKYSWHGYIMYSTLYTSAPTIPPFIIPLFTIQKPIVLLFTIQKKLLAGLYYV